MERTMPAPLQEMPLRRGQHKCGPAKPSLIWIKQ
jgi:hypothetical protein